MSHDWRGASELDQLAAGLNLGGPLPGALLPTAGAPLPGFAGGMPAGGGGYGGARQHGGGGGGAGGAGAYAGWQAMPPPGFVPGGVVPPTAGRPNQRGGPQQQHQQMPQIRGHAGMGMPPLPPGGGGYGAGGGGGGGGNGGACGGGGGGKGRGSRQQHGSERQQHGGERQHGEQRQHNNERQHGGERHQQSWRGGSGGNRSGGGGGGGGPSGGADFNANAPVFDPRGVSCLRSSGGDVEPSGRGVALVPTLDEDGQPSQVALALSPGMHLTPAQSQQFVAGAALAALARTGQSARHDAFFSPHTLRQESANRRAASLDVGEPSQSAALAGMAVRGFHTLVPLWLPSGAAPPATARGAAEGGPVRSFVCKATSSNDGEAYALRRAEGGVATEEAVAASSAW